MFLASVCTILGAVMFLRFGYAVGNVGLVGVLAIILLGHLVTIPTSLAIAEIATNRKVEGGGEYFIVSRSFGRSIGGAIGVPLFLSQAIVFPAFTGMTVGVGLSGDLKNPRRSIPLGILSATLVGMLVYVFLVTKLAGAASPAELADNYAAIMASTDSTSAGAACCTAGMSTSWACT